MAKRSSRHLDCAHPHARGAERTGRDGEHRSRDSTREAFTANLGGFHIEVIDPSLTRPSDARIDLISEDGHGSVVDRIANVAAVQLQPERLKTGDTRGRQIALATSAFDDQQLFTGSDTKDDDRTIQTAVGTQDAGAVAGRLRAQYVNKARPNAKTLTAVVDVCPAVMRSRLAVRVFNFTGGADVRTYLQQARSI